MTHYSVLHKGDTINIQFGGKEYLIDIVETKPDDQVCCVETNIELDFMAPKDYVEPPKLAKQTSTQKRAAEEAKDAERLAKVASNYTRIDGKELTQK